MVGNKLVSDFVVFDKYAHYLPSMDRRENWSEITDRYIQFMQERFPAYKDFLNGAAREAILSKRVLPSMRLMQTAGPAAAKNPARGYNCWYRALTSWDRLAEGLWVLLSGCGVGYSVQKRHVSEMESIYPPQSSQRYLVGDSIEGWADLFKALFRSYTSEAPLPVPDYRDIRRKGARITGCNGLAPGYKPLQEAFDAVKAKLDGWYGPPSPFLVHEIMCLMSEAVLSGGVRRSAMIAFFSRDDKEMLTCKTGNWWETKPHLQRANNSVVVPRDIEKDEFDSIWGYIKGSGTGDPGIFWVVNPNVLGNPCQPGSATVLTPKGIRTFDDIDKGSVIWSGSGWTTVVDKWQTGVKPVYRYNTTAGTFLGTENHRIVQGGEKVEVGSADSIDVSLGPLASTEIYRMDVMDGLVFGDGYYHHRHPILCIGGGDQDYYQSEVAGLIGDDYGAPGRARVSTTLAPGELPKTYERVVPDRFFRGDADTVCGFLRGLYSANGSICGGRVTLKATSKRVIEQVQQMLSAVGIQSYYTTNKAHDVEFGNGVYTCKESYDLNITADRQVFAEKIGFIQRHKTEKLLGLDVCGRRKRSFEIVSREYVGDEPVYDITVDCPEHTYWTGGLLVSNCGEISLYDGQFCNLTTINMERYSPGDEETAATLGTLQAALTDFYYLAPDVRRICEEQRIIGVSMSGVRPVTGLCNAQRVVAVNGWVSKDIGIEPAWRTTTIKPEGTASKVFGSGAAGCHPWYGRHMWQRMRLNKGTPICRYLYGKIPDLIDMDYTEREAVISLPLRAPDEATTRADLTTEDFLEHILRLNRRWIAPGHNRGVHHHNVSATVSVRDDEWDMVGEWVWANRGDYHGISVLPYFGGGHKHAPWEEITPKEWSEAEEYLVSASVDLSEVSESRDYTNRAGEISCAGGECAEL